MTDSPSASDIPDDIGRNDPCPCGSGRKFKKCCRRAHRVQKETKKKSQDPHRVIGPDTIAWNVFKRLRQIQENNALGLFYDLAHDEGDFRDRFAEKLNFVEAVDDGEIALPAGPSFQLAHIRLDPPDTCLVIREDDPKQDKVAFQLVVLRRNEVGADGEPRDVDHAGFRIWDYRRQRLERDQIDDDTPPMEALGVDWRSADE